MTFILKQSTADDILIGPFVDLTDGSTAETGESPVVKLSKNGQTMAAKNDVTTPVHDADGYYNCEFDATDTDTVGTMVVTVAASANALPVRHEIQIVEEAVYDLWYAAAATGDVKLQAITHTGAVIPTVSVNSDMRGTDGVDTATMRGTDSAALATALATAQNDLDIITGADGVTLATLQALYAPNKVVPPSVAQFNARSILSANYALEATLGGLITTVGVAGLGLSDLGGMSTVMKAEVNIEVKDVFATDTLTIPGKVAPSETPTPFDALSLVYKHFIFPIDQSATLFELRNFADTVTDQEATVSSDGTTSTRAKLVIGT